MQLRDNLDEGVEEQVEPMEVDKRTNRKDRLRGHKLSLTCVTVDSKGKYAYTGSKDGSIIKWCLETNKILSKINSISKQEADGDEEKGKRYHVRHINCMAISSDDRFLATGGWDRNIRIWSPIDLTWLHTFTMHRDEVTSLAFRQGHPTLYSGSADRSVMLWTLEDDDNRCFIEPLYGHESTVTSMDTLRKERVLTSGGRDQSIRIWKIVEQAQSVFPTKHESVDIVRYIDDRTFVSGGENGAITIWSTMKRTPVYSKEQAHGSGVTNAKDSQSLTLKYWINSLATYPLKCSPGITKVAAKKQKLDDDLDENVTKLAKIKHRHDDDGDDDDSIGSGDDDIDEEASDDDETQGSALCLIASGSCDSRLKIWKLTRNQGKYDLVLQQTFECPGFINEIRFTNDGSKVIAACGQEHRFGRWWKLKTKNSIRIFDVDR